MKRYCDPILCLIIVLIFGVSIALAQTNEILGSNQAKTTSPSDSLPVSYEPKAQDADKQMRTAFTLSEADEPPRIIRKIDPLYPSAAKVKNIEGEVTLRFIVTKEGKVAEASVVKGIPPGVFDNSALKALARWRFKPAIKDDKPVDVIIIAPLKFELINGHGPSGYDWYLIVQEGIAKIKQHKYKKAIKDLTKGIGYFPKYSGNSIAYSHRGLAYKMLGEYGKAIKDLNKALKLDSKQAYPFFNRADIYIIQKDYQKAWEDYSKAIELYPKNSVGYSRRGYASWLLNDFLEAVADCSKAISLDSGSINAYYVRGNAYRKLERYHDAVKDYSQVIAQNPEYTQAYNNRGYAYNKMGKTNETCADFKKACELGDCRGIELLQKQGGCVSDPGSSHATPIKAKAYPEKPASKPKELRTAYTLSEVDEPPKIIKRVNPSYPYDAKRDRIKGKVVLRFIVTREGKVAEASVVKGEPPGVFNSSAVKAVTKWEFKPAIKDGKFVDVIIIAPLKFELIK